jgi:phosphate transport system ATP-binding protein
MNGRDIYSPDIDMADLRQRVGMVFQKPNPFPQTIFDNIAYGPRVLGITRNRFELEQIVETSLRQAALWDEVKDGLRNPACVPEQQQRMSRLLAIKPR